MDMNPKVFMIQSTLLDRFFDTHLTVIDEFTKEKKIYACHKLILANLSKYFEKLFEKNSQFRVEITLPFSIKTMDFCIALIYANTDFENQIQLEDMPEIILASSYFLFPEDQLCKLISYFIFMVENRQDRLVLLHEFHDLMMELNFLEDRKKENVLDRIYHLMNQDLIPKRNPKFLYEPNQSTDQQIIFSDYTPYDGKDRSTVHIWKDLKFTFKIDYHNYIKANFDEIYISVSGSPLDEEFDLDRAYDLRKKRESGEEKLYRAQVWIEVFNGLQDPIQTLLTSENENMLSFPNKVSIVEHGRESYGINIPRKYILYNLMSVYKITIKFYDEH